MVEECLNARQPGEEKGLANTKVGIAKNKSLNKRMNKVVMIKIHR